MVTQARANLAGAARLHKIVVDRGFLDGTDLWWLDQQGILFVVPAKTNMAVTVDARAQAAAGEGLSHGRRVYTVRHGQGKTAWTERLQREQAAMGGEPIGWQRWRRQLLEHTRNLVIVFTQGTYGIFHLAEYSLLSGVKLKDVPPEIGTLPEILAKYRLRACG